MNGHANCHASGHTDEYSAERAGAAGSGVMQQRLRAGSDRRSAKRHRDEADDMEPLYPKRKRHGTDHSMRP